MFDSWSPSCFLFPIHDVLFDSFDFLSISYYRLCSNTKMFRICYINVFSILYYQIVFDSFSTVWVCVRFLFNSTGMCSIPFQQYRYVFDSGQAVDLCSISHSQIVFDSLLSICVRFLIKLFLIANHLLVFDFIINYAKFFFNSILITYIWFHFMHLNSISSHQFVDDFLSTSLFVFDSWS